MFPYGRSICFSASGSTLYNVHLEDVLMEEFKAFLDLCKCRTKFGFICIIFEIEINTFRISYRLVTYKLAKVAH